jgi:hypothetical protein
MADVKLAPTTPYVTWYIGGPLQGIKTLVDKWQQTISVKEPADCGIGDESMPVTYQYVLRCTKAYPEVGHWYYALIGTKEEETNPIIQRILDEREETRRLDDLRAAFDAARSARIQCNCGEYDNAYERGYGHDLTCPVYRYCEQYLNGGKEE